MQATCSFETSVAYTALYLIPLHTLVCLCSIYALHMDKVGNAGKIFVTKLTRFAFTWENNVQIDHEEMV
jgi:hypothetical protein